VDPFTPFTDVEAADVNAVVVAVVSKMGDFEDSFHLGFLTHEQAKGGVYTALRSLLLVRYPTLFGDRDKWRVQSGAKWRQIWQMVGRAIAARRKASIMEVHEAPTPDEQMAALRLALARAQQTLTEMTRLNTAGEAVLVQVVQIDKTLNP
jgi:hypothetical protein